MRNILKIFLLTGSLYLFLLPEQSLDIARSNFVNADNKLNILYKKILDIYKSDNVFISEFNNSQLLWIRYRDSVVSSRYSVKSNESLIDKYGDGARVGIVILKSRLTEERNIYLQEWVDGVPEGVVGSGNIRRK